MDKKIKEYILIETRDVINFKKYDELYSVFEKIVEYDVAAFAIEGISERLVSALQNIALNKIDRLELVKNFSEISSCFEPYVKKVLYLTDKNKYSELKKKDSSLPNYLEEIGLKVFVEKSKRTPRTDKLFMAYKLRNLESHECKKWSYSKLYFELQALLCAYLMVTEAQLSSLKKVLLGNTCNLNSFSKFDIASFKQLPPEQIIRFLRWGIICMNPMVKKISSEGFEFYFEKNGLAAKSMFEREKYLNNTAFKYYDEKDFVRMETHNETIQNGKRNEAMNSYCNLFYDSDNRYEKADYYKLVDDDWKLWKTMEFEYCLDGCLNIIECDYKVHSSNEKDILRWAEYHFNNDGSLMTIDTDKERIVFEYENNVLKKIVYPGGITEVSFVGDEQFFFKQEVNKSEKILKEKRYYENGYLVRIEYFNKDKKDNPAKMTNYWNIDYYPKTDA